MKVKIRCANCGKEYEKPLSQFKLYKIHFCCRDCKTNFARKHNTIKIKKDYAELTIISPKYGKLITLIDIEDINKIKLYTWGVRFDPALNGFYANCARFNGKNKHLHRYIMNTPSDMVVDHINHNTLDNRKSNLRNCTQKENTQNLLGAKCNNLSTKIRNVSWNKRMNKWIVGVNVNKKRKHVGYFNSLHDAEQAAIAARKKYYTHSLENMLKEDIIYANK